MAIERRLRIRDLRRAWVDAQRRAASATRGGPEYDAARAHADELEATYMSRLNRILDRTSERRGWLRAAGGCAPLGSGQRGREIRRGDVG